MKIDKTSVFALVLIFGLIGSLAYIFQLKTENKALQKSKSIIDDQLEEKKEKNLKEINSLDEVKVNNLDTILKLKEDKVERKTNLSNLDKKLKHYEETAHNNSDADSVEREFSKYYPDKPLPSKWSNSKR